MRALGYCRVSSLEQATGTSLRDQQAAIEAHAKAHDELRAALTRVDDELRGLAEAPRDTRPRRERLAEVDTLARAWEAATGAERRAIVRELAVSVAVSRAGVVPLWRSPR